MSDQTCLLCGKEEAFLRKEGPLNLVIWYNCKICGLYGVGSEASHSQYFRNPLYKARIRYWLLRQHLAIEKNALQEWPIFIVNVAKNEPGEHRFNLETICSASLPDVVEQSEKLIEFIGNAAKSFSETISFRFEEVVPIIGAVKDDDVLHHLKELESRGLVQPHLTMSKAEPRLTFDGWKEFHEIKRKPSKSNLAFMAMPFSHKDPEIPEIQQEMDEAFENYWKPAVIEAGFTDLRRVDQHPEPGGIDDIIRAKIRQSSFVIADLTGHNPNVYFEAGFAEACERPVLYLRHKNEASYGKFDIQSHTTITYDPDDTDSESTSKESMVFAKKSLIAAIQNKFHF